MGEVEPSLERPLAVTFETLHDRPRWMGPDRAAILQQARRRLRNPLVQDVMLAAGLTAASLLARWVHLSVDLPEGGEDVALRTWDGMGVWLLVLQTAPLLARRKAPVVVLAVVSTALFLFSISGYFRSIASFGFLVALYTVAAYRPRHVSIPAGIAVALVVLLILTLGREPIEPDAVIAECLIVGGAWFIGDSFRVRRRQVVELKDRAIRLEREREALAEAAVGEERRVIARELHDVVAHNVSVIVAQAGAAQRISGSHPSEALSTLGSIEATGREALVEMRRLMGLLRRTGERDGSRSPQPGLADLPPLVDQVRQAGLPVDLRIFGEPRPLPPGLDLFSYRIVQEALTNVLKHAGSARVEVLVRYGPSVLDLRITDDGVGLAGPNGDGSRQRYGHLGMRERVALLGGELWVGPLRDGGYRVEASLPVDGMAE